MLELSKVQFVEKPDLHRPNVKYILGCIRIQGEVRVDEKEKIPRTVAHDKIRETIWHQVYGDLLKPLVELQLYALRDVPPEHRLRVQELCEQINGLLALNVPSVGR